MKKFSLLSRDTHCAAAVAFGAIQLYSALCFAQTAKLNKIPLDQLLYYEAHCSSHSEKLILRLLENTARSRPNQKIDKLKSERTKQSLRFEECVGRLGFNGLGDAERVEADDLIKEARFKDALRGREVAEAERPPPPPELGMVSPIENIRIGLGYAEPLTTWRGYVSGILTTVAASGYEDDSQTGILYVESEVRDITVPGKWRTVEEHVYKSPSGFGFLSIASVDGDIVHLKAVSSGRPVTFDLRKLQFN